MQGKSSSFAYEPTTTYEFIFEYHRLQSSGWTAHLRVTGHISTGYDPKSSGSGGGILL